MPQSFMFWDLFLVGGVTNYISACFSGDTCIHMIWCADIEENYMIWLDTYKLSRVPSYQRVRHGTVTAEE